MLRSRLASQTNDEQEAVAVVSNGGLFVYKWDEDTGFGARYANPPGVFTGSFGESGCAFSPDGKTLIVAPPNFSATLTASFAWSGASGPTSTLAYPSSPENYNPKGPVEISPSGAAVAFGSPVLASDSTYKYLIYRYSSDTGFSSRYPLLSDSDFGAEIQRDPPCFSKAGTAIFLFGSYSGAAYAIRAWRWTDAAGFGTMYAAPSVSLTNSVVHMFVHPDNNAVGWTSSGGQSPTILRWDEVTGFGPQFASPSGRQISAAQSSFSPDGLAVVTSGQLSPYFTAFAWSSSGFGTKYANPSYTPPPDPGTSSVYFGRFAFSPSGGTIVAGQSGGTVGFAAMRWSSISGFGVKLSDPQSYTSSRPNQISFRKIPD